MSRTNIDIDDVAVATVMRRYHLETKKDAVNFALRTVASEPLTVEEARRLRGSGRHPAQQRTPWPGLER